jgi:hypothetical protein
VGGARYFSAGILICALGASGAVQHLTDTRTAADLPGPASLAAPPAPPQWVSNAPAAAPPAPPPKNTEGRFELVGHDPLLNRGMNAAIAVYGHYVYVGSRTDGSHPNSGVLVVDVADPAHPQVVDQIGPPDEANLAESSRELRVLPREGLLMVLNHGCSELIHACVNAATTAGVNLDHSTIRFYDVRGANAAAPKLVGTYTPSRSEAQIPHEIFLWSDPKRPGRVLLYETTPSTQDSGKQELMVADISHARENRFTEIARWKTTIPDPNADTRLHSLTVSYDGTRAYLAYLGGGFLVADTSDFAADRPNPAVRLITPVDKRLHWGDPGAHSAVQLPGRPWVLTTDEVYGKLGGLLPTHGCPWGWVRLIDVADPAAPRLAAEYKLAVNQKSVCENLPADRDNFGSFSSHNPTVTPDLALVTWHAMGLQAIDVSDPEHPKAAASYIPQPLPFVQTEDPALTAGRDKVAMWSFPIVNDGLIYTVDIRNGLYIFRYRGPFQDEISRSRFLDGNSNSGDVARFSGH